MIGTAYSFRVSAVIAILVQLAHKSTFNILCFSVSFDFDEPCQLGPRIQKT